MRTILLYFVSWAVLVVVVAIVLIERNKKK